MTDQEQARQRATVLRETKGIFKDYPLDADAVRKNTNEGARDLAQQTTLKGTSENGKR